MKRLFLKNYNHADIGATPKKYFEITLLNYILKLIYLE